MTVIKQPVAPAVAFGLAVLVALSFALYTNHVWEDYYITYRTSKNLATGHGLVFTPGEHVHTFTSPLGVLLPALASRLTGNRSDFAALWIFRVVGILAFGGAAALLAGALRRLGAGPFIAVLGAAFVALEAKAVDFSTNGMETGLLLLFLAHACWALSAETKHQWLHLGGAWAGIMWTRPDGFIYIGFFAGGYFLFNFFAAGRRDRGAVARLFLRAGLLCTALYLPWILWAWGYYGSPVPHTVIAKGSLSPGKTIRGFLATFAWLPVRLWDGHTSIDGTLMPTYYQAFVASPVTRFTARVAGAVALLAWFWPRLRPQTRAASFAFHGTHAYLTYFPYFPFPWYFPATCLFAAIVWAGLAAAAWNHVPPARWRRLAVLGASAWVLVFEACLTWNAARLMEAQQRLDYDGNLRRIGEWLGAQAAPGDRVFMEPLGYIGYFSQLATDDFPGLSSPRVVEARKKAADWSSLLLVLKPRWVVLRDSEIERIDREAPRLLRDTYESVRVFDVRPEVAKSVQPDAFVLTFDARFTVYRRRERYLMDNLILGVQHRFGVDAPAMLLDNHPVRMVHAPGTMSVRVPPGVRQVTASFGLMPGSYAEDPKTDGVTFEIYWAEGTTLRKLAARTLDPANRPGDRGLQTVVLALPAAAADRARLLLHTNQGQSTNKDWACWGDLDFK